MSAFKPDSLLDVDGNSSRISYFVLLLTDLSSGVRWRLLRFLRLLLGFLFCWLAEFSTLVLLLAGFLSLRFSLSAFGWRSCCLPLPWRLFFLFTGLLSVAVRLFSCCFWVLLFCLFPVLRSCWLVLFSSALFCVWGEGRLLRCLLFPCFLSLWLWWSRSLRRRLFALLPPFLGFPLLLYSGPSPSSAGSCAFSISFSKNDSICWKK